MEAKKDIVIIGAGGFAKEVLWLLKENNKVFEEWNILGFVDKLYRSEDYSIHGYHIIGNNEWLLGRNEPIHAVCAIGSSELRKKIIRTLENNKNIIFPNIISRHATISDDIVIGKGCIICAGSILTVDIQMGNYVTINLDCTVGHDTYLKDFVTLYPSVNVSGDVFIDEGTEVGTGTQIIQGKSIGSSSIIGAGAVVIRDIPDFCTAVGNPAKVIKQREKTNNEAY
ncbi:transferase [Anaerocolumna sedimenticola]|uniref:Transferase n=1 Tax=Anaerocolumna sedimenticola TaxID=2696063 RepID=A0A6P1TKN8_9FIRM|nr:acetyltransferase [Anaerocolumna sedimenticola]QHQ60699.1 transferase [Anaerocolumna sedimenticola]